jgi:hypothetical protein
MDLLFWLAIYRRYHATGRLVRRGFWANYKPITFRLMTSTVRGRTVIFRAIQDAEGEKM